MGYPTPVVVYSKVHADLAGKFFAASSAPALPGPDCTHDAGETAFAGTQGIGEVSWGLERPLGGFPASRRPLERPIGWGREYGTRAPLLGHVCPSRGCRIVSLKGSFRRGRAHARTANPGRACCRRSRCRGGGSKAST
jgi:hypothetical protein